MPRYDDAETLREARARYFAENGFGDGGYDARWVRVQLGPLPFYFPNTASRVRSVRLHDLHHVVTGYDTDIVGEGEIGAWEIGSNCRDHWAAWVLNVGAVGLGLFRSPRRLLRAFARGRRSWNLYEGEWDEALLDERVGDLRMRLGVEAALGPPVILDHLLFGLWSLAGLAMVVSLPALLIALLLGIFRA
jgi:hypothetical protein